MRITTVLSAVNYSDKYIRFVPLFIHQWKKVFPDIRIVIVFIGRKIPVCLQPYKEHIALFPEIEGLTSAYIAQTVRLVYPALLSDRETTLITDIDMLPGWNKDYYTTKLQDIPEDTFVSMRPLSVVGEDEIAMCYNVAKTRTWKTLFGIHSFHDSINFLVKHWSGGNGMHGGDGWTQDQHILYAFVQQKTVPSVVLDDSYMKRLDGIDHMYNKDVFIEKLRDPSYSDVHLYAEACSWFWTDMCELVKHI